mmetsp:Transcript_9246/g.33906  ORF Transcript_9246/g.33906 Transcript_9246/m.33906 type:complete len:115 (+) Transcript_9246:2418-2762(+)|eukprot:scaffold4274_cov376-Prasinococcus_capsulatus_cf.AAC.4
MDTYGTLSISRADGGLLVLPQPSAQAHQAASLPDMLLDKPQFVFLFNLGLESSRAHSPLLERQGASRARMVQQATRVGSPTCCPPVLQSALAVQVPAPSLCMVRLIHDKTRSQI